MTDAAPVPIENEEQREFQELVDSSLRLTVRSPINQQGFHESYSS